MLDTLRALNGGRTDSEFKFGCVGGPHHGANDLPFQRLSMYNESFPYDGYLLTQQEFDRTSSGFTAVEMIALFKPQNLCDKLFGAKSQHIVSPIAVLQSPLSLSLVRQYRLWCSASGC